MQIQVQALRQGYYKHKRVSEGQIFSMGKSALVEKSLVKDEKKLAELKKANRIIKFGKDEFVLPSWVKALDSKAKVQDEDAELASAFEEPTLGDEVI